jgi:hypothetical protein
MALEFIGGSGDAARAEKAYAAELERKTKLLRDENDRRSARQMKPGDVLSQDPSVNLSSWKQASEEEHRLTTPGASFVKEQIQRRAEASAAVKAADAASVNENTTISLKDLGLKALTVTAALGLMEKTIGAINQAQRDAADAKLSLDQRMAASGQELGLTPEQATQRRAGLNKFKMMTPEQAAGLQSSMAQSVSKVGPSYGAFGTQVLDVINSRVESGEISILTAQRFAAMDPAEAMAAMANFRANSKKQAGLGTDAAKATAGAQAPLNLAQEEAKWRGAALNRMKSEFEAGTTSGDITAPWFFPETRQAVNLTSELSSRHMQWAQRNNKTLFDIPPEVTLQYLKDIAQGVKQSPPSTNAGR